MPGFMLTCHSVQAESSKASCLKPHLSGLLPSYFHETEKTYTRKIGAEQQPLSNDWQSSVLEQDQLEETELVDRWLHVLGGSKLTTLPLSFLICKSKDEDGAYAMGLVVRIKWMSYEKCLEQYVAHINNNSEHDFLLIENTQQILKL